jgi:SAM-dependent methyltransferase
MNKALIEKRLREEAPAQFRYNYEIIKGSGIWTHGRMQINYDKVFKKLRFKPSGFRGKRVLEIGTYDGALAFYLEDQGADVLAVDVQEPSMAGFSLVHELRQSKVKYEIMSVYDLDPAFIGTFDCITFFGVFYHLKYPLLAFDRLNGVCKQGGRLFCGGALGDAFFYNGTMNSGCDFSAFTKDNFPDGFYGKTRSASELPYCAFVETEYLHDRSNWFLPNGRCVHAWLKRAGFEVNRSHVSFSLIEQNPGHDYSRLGLPETADGASRASGHFAATRTGPAEPEFDFPGYVGKNVIPTRLAMEALEKRVKDLEAEAAKRDS